MHKERPILFSTDMVQALLAGKKTQTRRTVKPHPDDDGLHNHSAQPMHVFDEAEGWWGTVGETGEKKRFKCRYGQPGDFLWVRESWNKYYSGDEENFSFRATDPEFPFKGWKPSIHMPKAACRIWLELTGIRVERVQDISEEDAVAEGVERINFDETEMLAFKSYATGTGPVYPYVSYKTLWQKINGPESWESNPWVWVVAFKVLSTTGKPENL